MRSVTSESKNENMGMHKKTILYTVVLTTIFLLSGTTLLAQGNSPSAKDTQQKKQSPFLNYKRTPTSDEIVNAAMG
jgi:hypothetical protein